MMDNTQAMVTIDPETGEELTAAAQAATSLALRSDIYAGLSMQPVDDAQAAALLKQLTFDDVEIKPDQNGAVYLSHPGYRKRLNEAFGPAGWALRPLSPIKYDDASGVIYREYALYAGGRFLGSAIGEQKYQKNNPEMTYGDAVEGAKSNALMRCCKDLGMAMECWDRQWTNKFRAEQCVKVWVKKGPDSKARLQWRRLSDMPFYGEYNVADDSPNRDKWVKPIMPGSAGNSNATKAQMQTSSGPKTISYKQAKRLWAIAKEEGVSESMVKEYLITTFKIEKTTDIKAADYETVIEWLKAGGDTSNDDQGDDQGSDDDQDDDYKG
jgi:hypothetical protein